LRGTLLALLLVASLAFVVAGCGSSSSSSSEAATTEESEAETEGGPGGEEGETEAASIPAYSGPEKGLPTEYATGVKAKGSCTIGYQNIFGAISSLAAEQEAAEEEASALGCKIITLDDQLNPTTQVNNFNQLLSQNPSAIVVYPIVPSALSPSLKQAEAAGIPVLSDTTPPDVSEPLPSGYASRVQQSWDQVAYLRAKYVAENNPGTEFAIIGLAAPVFSLQYLGERTKYWAEKFGLKFAGEIDAQEDNPSSASTAMSAVLGKYSGVGAVFAYNDNTAVAAATVAKSSQAEVEICGANGQKEAFQAIEQGSMACTVWIDFLSLGKQLVRGAYDAFAGEEIPQTVAVPVEIVSSDNVSSLEPIG
jgi:ABC-type sugar transport system substrate-binding protein